MKPVAPDLAVRIQRRIDDLRPPDSLGHWPTRVCKRELNALPLHGNWVYLWALQPDGTVLCMDHEALGHPTEPETDPLVIYAVLAHGSRIYPELPELVPARPEGARPCSVCEAAGMVKSGLESYDSCLGCRGLGYVAR